MKMKKYGSFDEYFADQSPKNRSIIRTLRTFVKRVAPGLQESVKWGNDFRISAETSTTPRLSVSFRCLNDGHDSRSPAISERHGFPG